MYTRKDLEQSEKTVQKAAANYLSFYPFFLAVRGPMDVLNRDDPKLRIQSAREATIAVNYTRDSARLATTIRYVVCCRHYHF